MNQNTRINTEDYIKTTIKSVESFYEAWTKKYQEFDDGFDKFISIYIGFNSLYEATTRIFLLDEKITYEDYTKKYEHIEINRAADIITQLLEAKSQDIMDDKIIKNEIPEIEDIIKNSNYYFDFRPLDKGGFKNIASGVLSTENIPVKSLEKLIEKSKDEKLLKDLKSADPKISLNALLRLLYKVRCNIFHGNKAYQHQMSLRVKKYAAILELIYAEAYKEWKMISGQLKAKYDS